MKHTVHNAKMLGTVKIVTYDWLEDSLQAATRRPKTEGPYLLQNLMKPNKPEKKVAKNGPTKVSKKEGKSVAPKRQIGIFAGVHCLTAIYVIILTQHLQPILSWPQREKRRVSMVLIR